MMTGIGVKIVKCVKTVVAVRSSSVMMARLWSRNPTSC